MFLLEEAEDLAHDFFAEKYKRPAWIRYIHQCSQTLSEWRLPPTLRTDFRSYVLRRLKRLQRTASLLDSFLEFDHPKYETLTSADLLDVLSLDLRQVFDLLRQGFKQKEIAHRLGMSERTVRTRLKAIKRLGRRKSAIAQLS